MVVAAPVLEGAWGAVLRLEGAGEAPRSGVSVGAVPGLERVGRLPSQRSEGRAAHVGGGRGGGGTQAG